MGKHSNALKTLAAEAAECVLQTNYDVDWWQTSARFGLSKFVEENERLTRAQRFHDSDYPSQISSFVMDAHGESPEQLRRLLLRIVGTPTDELRTEYPTLALFMETAAATPEIAALPALPASVKYLDVTLLPDDFYRDLVQQVNDCYRFSMYPAQLILLRKLMENLVIDLLRKKYGTADLGSYYDTGRGRFHDFAVLIQNLKDRASDFSSTTSNLEGAVFAQIQKFRSKGNSNAHTIDVHVTRKSLDELQSDATHLVKLMAAIYDRTLRAA